MAHLDFRDFTRVTIAVVVLLGFGASARGNNSPVERTLSTNWSIQIGTYTDSSPAIGKDGTIYLGAFDGKLWAINPDGTRKWVFRAGLEIRSSPAVGADDTVFVGSRDRKFYALSAKGTKKWEFTTGGWVDSSAAIARDGGVYFGSWDGTLYALSPRGEVDWRFETGGPVVSSPSVGADGVIYFGSHDRKFYALNPEGEKKWEFTTGGAITCSPAVNGVDCVYFTSLDGHLYSVNLDGSLRWKLHTGSITQASPVVGMNGTIFVGVNTNMWSLTPTGETIWKWATYDYFENSGIAFDDGSFGFISRYGSLFCLTPERLLIGHIYVYGQGDGSPTVGPDGTIYMSSYLRTQDFSAIGNHQKLAPSPWPKFRGNIRNTGNAYDHFR